MVKSCPTLESIYLLEHIKGLVGRFEGRLRALYKGGKRGSRANYKARRAISNRSQCKITKYYIANSRRSRRKDSSESKSNTGH